MWNRIARGIATGAALACLAQGQQKEQPSAMVLDSQNGKLRRAGASLPVTVSKGEFLFPGDSVVTEDGPVTLLFCPQKSTIVLGAKGEFILGSDQVAAIRGAVGEKKPVATCLLPQVERLPDAALRNYGSSMRARGGETKGTFESRVAALGEAQRALLNADLAGVNAALAANPNDVAALMSRVTVLRRAGLDSDAAETVRRIEELMGETPRTRGLIHEAESKGRRGEDEDDPDSRLAGGQTYALLVGVSSFQKLQKDLWLEFADRDAETFSTFLQTKRVGGVPAANIQLLLNEKATRANIRSGMTDFLNRAGKKDTVIVLLATHGVVDDNGTKDAYLIAYDSDPQDLRTTGVPMAEISALMENQLKNVGRALVYVDVCRAGTIGSIKSNNVNEALDKQVFSKPGELLGFMASRATEYSWESRTFGGGHGAFTYFLLNAMLGQDNADKNNDGELDANELINHVSEFVAKGTRDQQHPVVRVAIPNSAVLVKDLDSPAISLDRWQPLPQVVSKRSGAVSRALPPAQTRKEKARDAEVAEFEAAIDAGRILPETPGSAYNLLRDRLRGRLTREQYRLAQNELRVALEDQGQQVLLKYLAGEQVAQTAEDFRRGALYFNAARLLTPESQELASKEIFCRGRVQLFEKRYAEGVKLLEQAIQIDGKGAYSYNGIGIAYLEQARFDLAAAAFQDAIRLAPHWAYPRHNLALTLTERGDYQGALKQYQEAMAKAPTFAYLPYNQGLVYQRLNRRSEAEASYRKALSIDPNMADAYNALGFLYATGGKFEQAEKHYRLALDKQPGMLAARHNLALLLASRKGRQDDAIALWRQNLTDNGSYLPSRLKLAEELAKLGRTAEAVTEYGKVLELKPDFAAARLEMARLLSKDGKADEAAAQLREAIRRRPNHAEAYEALGDLEAARGRKAEAEAAYGSAMKASTDPAVRKRLKKKGAKG